MDRNQKESKKKYPRFWNDDRSVEQKIVTEKLVKKVSQNNWNSHLNLQFSIFLHPTSIVFVTICGVPPHDNQFSFFKFPGKVINYYPPCFDPAQNENAYQNKLSQISMQNSAIQIDQIVRKNGSQVILIYHSFGGSIAAWYSKKYPQKVKGLISLGGPPVRFYPILKDYAKSYLSIPDVNRQFVIENYEVVYSLYDSKMKNHSSKVRFKNKFQLLSFTLHNDKQTLQILFETIRKLPLPILMIYGQNDDVLTPSLCYQTMAYMSYIRNQNENNLKDYEKQKRYLKIHSQGTQQKSNQLLNLQQKLAYLLPGGHSIHINSKNVAPIQQLIDEYLYIMIGGDLIPKGKQNTEMNKKSKL